jgi:hypothetical protein
MSVVLDLPPKLENELATEAAHLGLALPEYILRLLAEGRPTPSAPRTGAELLAYWQREDLVGKRTEILDSHVHARALREQANREAESL